MDFDLALKAFVYPAADSSVVESVSPCLCSLVFRCDNRKLATLLLFAQMPTAHASSYSEFVLQYDGDNLMPDKAKLSSGKGHLEQTQLDVINPVKGKGKKRPDIKTLELSTKQPPPVWCPTSIPTFSPRPGSEPHVQRLVDVAKATTLHIIFDFSQLHKRYQSAFKAFSKAARGLVGYSVDTSLTRRGLKKASWDVFAPTELAAAPPAYEGFRSRKRPRHESSDLPLQPPRCCTPKSPTGSHSSEKTIPFSPESEAAILKRVQLGNYTEMISTVLDKRLAAHLDELKTLQAEAINAAVAKRFKAYFDTQLQAVAVDVVVSRHVDAAVQERLPKTVRDLFAPQDLPSSPGQRSISYDSLGNIYPKLPSLTPAGEALLPHLAAHLTDQFKLYQDQQFQRFERLLEAKHDDVARSAEDDRIREQDEWEQEREEHMVDISLMKKETTDELWRQGLDMLEQGKQLCLEFGDDINEQLFELVEKINKLNRCSLRKLMATEVSKATRQQRKKKGIPKGFGRNLLTHPNPKSLMKKMIADSEWEDI